MKFFKHFVVSLALLLSVLAWTGPVNAWTRSNYSERNGSADRDLRVPSGRLAFRIESRGSFKITDGSDIDAIRAAFQRISAVPTSLASLDDGGQFSLPVSVAARDGLKLDGSNSVYFFRTPDPAYPAIAITTVFYDANTGDIKEADIAINEADYDYSTVDPGSPNEPLDPYTFDIQEIVTHECMHALGFGHSAVIGRFDPATGCQMSGWITGDFSLHSTMFPFASGTIAGRTLTTDDVAALTAVYPNGTPAGSISGRIVRGDSGLPVKGAHVVAVRVDDPETPVVATISGIAEGAASGDFTIAGIPPGEYYVRIEPLIGTTNPFTEQMTAFTHFDTSFAPEFYSGESETSWDSSPSMEGASPIRVEAGSRVTGVAFVTNFEPAAPVVTKATFKAGKLKVSGAHFIVGFMACEVDGHHVDDLHFPTNCVSANGMSTRLLSRDVSLGAMLEGTSYHSLVVINLVTGARSEPMLVLQ
jgi:hypothetical protein